MKQAIALLSLALAGAFVGTSAPRGVSDVLRVSAASDAANTAIESRRFEVRIVGPDGSPVANAEAHCVAWPRVVPRGLASRSVETQAGGVAPAASTAAGGAATAVVLWSDAEGRIRPPTTGGPVRIAAKAGRLRARATFDPAAQGEAIGVLELKSGAAVLVVDHEGNPAADVLTQVVMSDVWQALAGDDARCRTGRDGLASFDGRWVADAAWTAAAVAEARTGRKSTALLVAAIAGLPLAQCPAVAFPDRDDAPPVRLRLPPTGAVEIRVVDAKGSPYLRPADVAVFAEFDESWTAMQFGAADPTIVERTTIAARTERGVARIGRAATNGKSRAVVWIADTTRRPTHVLFDGPAPGGTATIVLAAPNPRLRFTGRFVDAEGEPVADATASLQLEDSPALRRFLGDLDFTRASRVQTSDTTAKEGLFEASCGQDALLFPGCSLAITGERLLGPGARRAGSRETSASFTAEVRAGRPDDEGFVRLGDVRVAFEDSGASYVAFAEGVVVDEHGEPVAGAQVSLRRRLTRREARYGSTELISNFETGVDRGWTDANGRFVLFRSTSPVGPEFGFDRPDFEAAAEEAVAERRLYATKSGLWCHEAPAVSAGARDVRIVMRRSGGFAGSIAVGVDAERLQELEITAAGPAIEPVLMREERVMERTWPVSRQGRDFGLQDLKPGPVRVLVRHPALAEAVTVALEIRAGEVLRDPRLADIDLRKLLRKVSVVDEAGRPIASAVAHFARDGEDWKRRPVDRSGVVLSPLRTEAETIVVTAEGYRPAEATGTEPDLRVVLSKERFKQVRLRLAPGVVPPKAGVRCVIEVNPVIEATRTGSRVEDVVRFEKLRTRQLSDPRRPRARMASLDPVVGAVGEVPVGAKFDVSIRVKGERDRMLWSVGQTTFTVLDDGDELIVDLTPDSARWESYALGTEIQRQEERYKDGD